MMVQEHKIEQIRTSLLQKRHDFLHWHEYLLSEFFSRKFFLDFHDGFEIVHCEQWYIFSISLTQGNAGPCLWAEYLCSDTNPPGRNINWFWQLRFFKSFWFQWKSMKCQSFSPKNNLNDTTQFSEDIWEIYIWKNLLK